MSKRKRDIAREKVDRAISYFESTAAAGEADITRATLEGIADIAFGIWSALDQISESIKNG